MGKKTRSTSKKATPSAKSYVEEEELHNLGPSTDAEPHAIVEPPPPPPPPVEDNSASPAENPFFMPCGLGIVFMLFVVCVWSIVLIPVYIVSDNQNQPSHLSGIYKSSKCLVAARYAQIRGSADDKTNLLNCLNDLSSIVSSGDVTAAQAAAKTEDYYTAAKSLKTGLTNLVSDSLNGDNSKSKNVWSTVLRALAVESTRGYAINAAQTGNAPTTRTFQDVVTTLFSSPYPLSIFGVNPVSTVANMQRELLTQRDYESADLKAATPLTGIAPRASLSDMKLEALRALDALQVLIDQAQSDSDSAARNALADDVVTGVLLALASSVCIGGSVFVGFLTRRYSATEAYRRVVRSDFEVVADSAHAVPKESVLRAVSLACAKLSVLDSAPDPGINENDGQLVLHLRRITKSIEAIRPFVPEFAFSRSKTFEAFNRTYRRLSMGPGLEKEPRCTVVAVGLRDFHKEGADLTALPEFINAVHAAAAASDGTVAQISPTHVIIVFSRLSEDAVEESINIERFNASVQGVRAAFMILASGVQLQAQYPSLSISIAVSQGCALVGPLTTQSVKVFAAASNIVTTAIHMEAWTRDLGICVVCDTETATAVEEEILTRPVSLCTPRSTNMHEVVLDYRVGSSVPGVKERCTRWKQTFEKYEEAVRTLSPDKLEEAFSDLQAYRQFAVAASGTAEVEDLVFTRIAEHLRRLMADIGVKV